MIIDGFTGNILHPLRLLIYGSEFGDSVELSNGSNVTPVQEIGSKSTSKSSQQLQWPSYGQGGGSNRSITTGTKGYDS